MSTTTARNAPAPASAVRKNVAAWQRKVEVGGDGIAGDRHLKVCAHQEEQRGILFDLRDFLELVDYTGRAVRPAKRGAIPGHLPDILHRLELNADDWLAQATGFEKLYEQRHSRRRQIERRKSA